MSPILGRSFVVSDAIVAGSIAALVSGAPSTVHALWRGADGLDPSLAAGTLLLPHDHRRRRLLAGAALVHSALSFGWALTLSAALPRRATIRWSVLAGLGIAALDLGVVGRHFERIRALSPLPQIADHIAFATTVGAVLVRRRDSRERTLGPIRSG